MTVYIASGVAWWFITMHEAHITSTYIASQHYSYVYLITMCNINVITVTITNCNFLLCSIIHCTLCSYYVYGRYVLYPTMCDNIATVAQRWECMTRINLASHTASTCTQELYPHKLLNTHMYGYLAS